MGEQRAYETPKGRPEEHGPRDRHGGRDRVIQSRTEFGSAVK